MTAATANKTEFETLPLSAIEVAPWNARKTINPAGLDELISSIRCYGLQTPLLVRPRGSSKAPTYEIVAGHRRFAALTRLEAEGAPCIVRAMDDQTAREVGLVENLQREGVPALEEAEAFGELLEIHGSIPAVAFRVGKEQSYVAKWLKLLTLTTPSRQSLLLQLISIDHAMLLARLADAEQNDALKWCLDTQAGAKKKVEDVVAEIAKRRHPELYEGAEEDAEDGAVEDMRRSRSRREWEPESVLRLKEHIECESGTPLGLAPWPMEEDWLVADAGSCLDCPKNTKANTPLFGDLDMGVAVCTDGSCFKAKVQGFVEIQLRDTAKELAAKLGRKSPGDVEVVRVSWKLTSTPPRQLKDGGGVNPAQTFKDGQWIEATKKCDSVRPAVTVDWSYTNDRGHMGGDDNLRKPGEIVQVCIEPKCKAHPKAYEKAKVANNGSHREGSAAEAERKEKTRLAALAETELRARLAGEALERVKTIPEKALRKVLLEQLPNGSELELFNAILPGLEKIMRTSKAGSVEFAKAVALASIEGRHIEVWQSWGAEQYRKEFIEDLAGLGYDASKAWDKPKPAKKAAAKPAKKAVKKAVKKAAKKAVRK